MTAGMATSRPKAVVTSASAMPAGDRAEAAGAGGGHGLEGGDDADHGAEQPDERGGGADGGERAQAAAQVGDGAERAAVDGAVHGRDDVEVADLVLAAVRLMRLQAVPVLLERQAEHPGQVALRVLLGVGELDRLLELAGGQQRRRARSANFREAAPARE